MFASDSPIQFGVDIARQIALRELSRLQTEFLSQLAESQLAPHLALAGSGGIHGVYLHGRQVINLDFVAPAVIVMRFPNAARSAGFEVHAADGIDCYKVGKTSAITPNIGLRVRLAPKDQSLSTSETGSYRAWDGSLSTVRTLPLVALLGQKLATIFLRAEAKDFWDLWYAFKSQPDLIPQLKELLRRSAGTRSSHSPPYPFDAAAALNCLQVLEPNWSDMLLSCGASNVEYSDVRSDLGQWLPALNTRRS